MRLKFRPARNVAAGVCALSVALHDASAAAAADAPQTPTFTKDIAPIFQEKCEACHRPDSIAPMSLITFTEARPWARSIKARVADRQMPPWQIDRTVGIQKFKNDRSLTDDQIETIVRWVDAGAPQGDPKDMPAAKQWPDGQGWNFAAAFGQKEPDLIIKSHDLTMPALVAGRVGQARHAVRDHRAAMGSRDRNPARDDEGPQDYASRDCLPRTDGAGRRRTMPGLPTPFMEWAVGKQGEMMRPDTGKLLLPGSKFHWDIHYSQAGEEITNKVEMGIYFYPKGQEPKYRNTLSLVPAALGTLDIRPNSVAVVEGFTTLREAARLESFQPHMHLRGQGDDGRSDPAERPEAGDQPGQRLQLQLDDHLRLRRRSGAAAAEGDDPQGDGVARQHQRQEEQSRSESMGRMGRSHGGRNGPRVDQHRLHERRRVQGRAGQAPRGSDDDRAIAELAGLVLSPDTLTRGPTRSCGTAAACSLSPSRRPSHRGEWREGTARLALN